ncbi:ECF-type sigma factor [Lentisalinibacter orientalis]|uniref:ECF-type sigma factor n=1 Tax=Lentisalinibacter orientalis TaxID=2992241 RepID=UPI00386C4173
MSDITQLIAAAAGGDADASEELFSLVYAELRKIARSHRRRWQGDETVGTTVLIHEAYLRLAESGGSYENRRHFYATASRAMRQVLMNYAEKRLALKRHGERAAVQPDDLPLADERTIEDLLALEQLLGRLELDSPRRCRIIECRVFGGMSIDDTAAALSISPATVKREWAVASAWLYREMKTDFMPGAVP